MNNKYGAEVTVDQVEDLLQVCIDTNKTLEDENKSKLSMCIWGQHGIGKTEMVKYFCKKNNYDYAYFSLAQTDEKGDLAGLPVQSDNVTTYLTPEFFPHETELTAGIFLIDDFNRGDERMVMSIMQLIQNYVMLSTTIPKKWTIVLTGNPHEMGYDVVEVKGAWLTRTLCCTMKFNMDRWIDWLEDNMTNYEVVDFIKSQKDIVQKAILSTNEDNAYTDNLTTPRSITQFFLSYNHIENNKFTLIKNVGKGFIDYIIVEHFISYLKDKLINLPNIHEILNNDWQTTKKELSNLLKNDIHRSSMCNILIHRIKSYCIKNKHDVDDIVIDNILNFLISDFLPIDLKVTLRTILIKFPKKYNKILVHPKVYDIG